MRERQFYMTFMIYLIIGTVLSVCAFDAMSTIAATLNNYLLGIVLVIPMLLLLLLLTIIGASELAFFTSFKKAKVNAETFLASLKLMLEGVGIVVIAVPIYYLVRNTFWIIESGYSGLDIPLGGLIVSSLILVGGICVLSQTYLTLAETVKKHNKAVKVK